jgi:putative lipoic acid-binding regulatory protein
MSENESLLTFPCSFPIKIMGRDEESFRHAAVLLVEQYAGKLSADAITTSASSKGNFLSITITIQAQNQEQLDNIYNDLSKHEEVLVAL